MIYETCCVNTTIDEWEKLMKGARKCSYNRLVRMIRKDCPEIYHALALDIPNPYSEQCKQTKTHYILVHSAIEYFFKKQAV